MKTLKVYDPHKRKWVKVGTIKDDILYKQVLPEHFMRLSDSYAIQYSVLEEVLKLKKIVIIEQTGVRWESKPMDWFTKGKVADYSYGKQVFLSLKYMKQVKPFINADKAPSIDNGVMARLSEEFKRKYK